MEDADRKHPENPPGAISKELNQQIFETESFVVCASGQPHVSREEGGHIILYAKADVTDRTKLTPKQAVEYMRLSMLVGEALEKAMTVRGVHIVKVNYLDNGNWAFKYNCKPHLHMHILGRSADAKIQRFPEAVLLPAMESGFYDSFEALNDDDIAEILLQLELLLQEERFSTVNWLA